MTEQVRTDEMYMRRCLQLARLGQGHVSPNPMVGAVIVCDGRIIGEGYHRKWGEAHAEVNAVASVRDRSLLRRSTIYVSLEPCSHYGKTPPCCRLIAECGIPRVVVGCPDPFPEVSGRGIRMLREAGAEVTVGVLEQECRELNRCFMKVQTEQRPYVVLKWAQSADGYIDRCRTAAEPPTVISDAVTSVLVHRLRAHCDAVLVGRRTAEMDNPSLTVRRWTGNAPVRIVIDRHLSLPPDLRLFTDGGRTWVFTAESRPPEGAVEYITLDFSQPVVPALLRCLHEREIQSLLVEGGACTLQHFIDAGEWDEARIEIGKQMLKNGIPAPAVPGTEIGTERHGESKLIRTINR
ncbi:MAG: bifunctional diaminohydroxyphosphoribosylaminopyrimidine deaminase/5-amino-6-(5-phosphoribosylamino)uracil reductase RibD [Coprobacter sp.]|nr:bifunctional diaminohydroxyphosphoribosylaminopyrimidine deaminase/5-amino-6-(5-phosphoribosylamino)uracil reductase RibD [Coprobacter sp.]